ncbi:MAG: hypothetical protein UX31_C0038G0002 [Candidatus Nomurabacteria bacterium GW2011_GWA1_46_11]|uniref:Uncharacterized protein n=2 Tax=Patescibacteria group TaxID=1783273 RepID=A0A0G1NIS4_9BACT|nr:MAG: hypothetical protein UX31_C0038G0002 [Candidatus Nomurabacteria bacterium GW2011_GWA1_46_11]
MRDTELPSYYCQKLAALKLCSDELPRKLVGMWHPDFPFMKCRGNVIASIGQSLNMSVHQGIIADQNLKASIEEFVQYPWNAFDRDQGVKKTTHKEIQLMNGMLDTVIGYIEMTYKVTTDWESARRKLEYERKEVRKGYEEVVSI